MSKTKKFDRDRISRIMADEKLITKALARGVYEAMVKHKKDGHYIVVYRDGKTVKVLPEEIDLEKLKERFEKEFKEKLE